VTVTGTFNYDVRPYSGYEDPGLPIASYIAQGGLAGDASGGTIIFNFPFMLEQEEKITELFNLEQLTADHDDVATADVVMRTVNMDTLSRNRSATSQQWSFTTVNVSAALGGSVMALTRRQLPLWLGSPNLDARAGTALLRFTFVNVDLRLCFISIQGYIWGSRSILAPGGPRRPVGGGLFGT